MKMRSADLRPPVRLAHLVRVAHRGFYRGMLLRLAERGIPVGHWMVLRMLWENGKLTQREMSESSGLRESTIFAALKGMEKLGLIERRPNRENRREIHISLTRRGRELEKTLLPIAYEMNEIAIQGLDAKTIAIVWRALEVMIKNFEIDEAERNKENRKVPSTRAVAREAGRARRRRVRPARPLDATSSLRIP